MNELETLLHAVTEYDRRQQARRPGEYNTYALPQYLGAVYNAFDALESGECSTIRESLISCFSGRLLDACLKALGEPKFTREEMFGSRPVSRFS